MKQLSLTQKIIAVSISLSGAGTLVGSYFVSGWNESLLLNLGTAALLFVPLYAVQRSLEARVEMRQEVIDRRVESVASAVRGTLNMANLQSLEQAGLTRFLAENQPHYLDLARKAFDYVRQVLKPTGLPLREADLVQAVTPALYVDAQLNQYLEAHRLTQKYWHTRFAQLVVDQLWDEVWRQ